MPAIVERAKLELLLPVNKMTGSGRTIGHEFKVSIRLRDIRHCELRWWEKTDRPYVEGMSPNVWCDMFELHPQSEVFWQWNYHVNSIPLGEAEFELSDPPGIMVDQTKRRELSFEIQVVECNPYSDTNKQRTIRAKQILQTDPPPFIQNFLIMENDFVRRPSMGPPIW